MKRKDDLLRLAFGELSDDVAQTVEARTDASERAEVEAFRQLREDLRHLPPPPPDTLSAERLRAAILDRELKAKRPFAWASLVAPVALAAIAAVVILPRLRPRAEPQIVTLTDSRVERDNNFGRDFNAALRPLSVAAPARAPAAVEVGATAAKARTLATSVVPTAVRGQSVLRHHRGRRHRVAVPTEEPQLKNDGLLAVVVPHPSESEPPSEIAAPPSKVVQAEPGSEGKTETVVIVSTKRDLETGAPAATETEASSVLVGG